MEVHHHPQLTHRPKPGKNIWGIMRTLRMPPSSEIPFWTLNRKCKMQKKPKTFDEHVVRGILANNSFGITEVADLRSIKSMYLERERYPFIASLIRDKNLAELMKMPAGAKNSKFQEYLEIIQFKSPDGLNFIATVYDSLELWQDPQIIDIFSLG